jgi:hypothetical protein
VRSGRRVGRCYACEAGNQYCRARTCTEIHNTVFPDVRTVPRMTPDGVR